MMFVVIFKMLCWMSAHGGGFAFGLDPALEKCPKLYGVISRRNS